MVVTMDIVDRRSVDAAAAELKQRHTSIDVLICNAAINPAGDISEMTPLPDVDEEDLLHTFDVNVAGTLRTAQSFYPFLKESEDAKIVVISSGAGSISGASAGNMIPYCVSKAAVNMLCRRLHYLLQEDDIPVLALSPGWVKTDMGGPNAQISPQESALGVCSVIAKFSKNSEPFQTYRGDPIAW